MDKRIGEWITNGDWQAVQESFNAQEFMQRLGVSVDLSDPEHPRCSVEHVESYHLGGIGQDFVNGAVISAVLDIAIGLTGMRFAKHGYFATRSLQIDLALPVEKHGFYVVSRSTSQIGRNLFAEARVFNPAGEARVHATGVVRIGIKAS